MTEEPKRKLFILYDARAGSGDTDDASVLDTANSKREMKRISRDHWGENVVWYEYDIDGKMLINKRRL
jgi:hypothetical protein